MLDYQVVSNSGSDLSNCNPTEIKVIGCGGGGCNAVDDMIRANIENVEFIALNTDLQTLKRSMAQTKIAIGQQKTGGRGAGGNPEIGQTAAEEDKDVIKNALSGANMVFITAGMGGGTGTGSAPVVAKIARELGALTVCVVTTPFAFEGKPRMKTALEGIEKLRKEVDSLIVVPNQKLIDMATKKMTFVESFAEADEVLRQGVQGISDIVTKPGYVNTDFADVSAAMKDQGDALLGIGVASGENRAVEAANKAINNPLLDDTSIDHAKNILVNITGSQNVLIEEIESIMDIIRASADENANIFWGQVADDNMGENLSVTVIATGFRKALEEQKAKEDAEIEKRKTEELNKKKEAEHNQTNVSLDDWNSIMMGRNARSSSFNPMQSSASQDSGYGTFVSSSGTVSSHSQAQAVENAAEKPAVQPTIRFDPSRISSTQRNYSSELEEPAVTRQLRERELSRKIRLGQQQ